MLGVVQCEVALEVPQVEEGEVNLTGTSKGRFLKLDSLGLGHASSSLFEL